MNYEEREKILCNNCEAKENCSYISRNLERKCSFKETTMYGWELGQQDTIDKAIEWLDEHLLEYWGQQNSDPSNFLIDFKKAMEESK